MEQCATTTDWEELVDGCDAAIDFALDGLIFAADSESLLSRVAERLFADEARLAKRLIRRAVVVCTTANRLLLERATTDLDSPTPFLRTIFRDPRPFHFFFGSLLRYLATQKRRLTEAVSKDAAELAKVWLQMTPGDWPHRDAAAEIAMTVAEQTLTDREDYRRSVDDKAAEIIYAASLAAFREQPDLARKFFLQASGLEPATGGDGKSSVCASGERDREAAKWRTHPVGQAGLLRRRTRHFGTRVLTGGAMECLFATDPVLAEQILLALMIDVRHPDEVGNDYFSAFDESHCGLILPGPSFSAPHYREGPFLDFLHAAPREGISLILKIVNFASNCATAATRKRRPGDICSIPSPTVPGVAWSGNESVYAWNRGRMDSCSRAVVPLVLEKWLGDDLAHGEQIAREIDLILADSKSVAFGGVLIDLGRRHPQLFDGPLRCLLQSPILLIWAEMQINDSGVMLFRGPETRLG